LTKVIEKYAGESDRPLFICDYSPPRGGDPKLFEPVRNLDVDFVSVAYNPAKSARVLSAIAAYWIKENTGLDVVFSIATRDTNTLAAQSLLLGTQVLGLDNVIVVKGDDFNDRERALVKDVNDAPPTDLMRSIAQMNEGRDYKGLKLRSPTDFCIGASMDLGRGLEREAKLTRRKVEAGTQYFISQPTFNPSLAKEFLELYEERHEHELDEPVFHGIQVMTRESIPFGDIPQWVTDDLAKGRSGVDLALQVLHEFKAAGFRSFYLVPPILKGGLRDYEVAQAVVDAFRAR
jgi:homocysteine S-methyltransferase